jgi:hypothetical protein
MPVLDGGRIVGIISPRDLVRTVPGIGGVTTVRPVG